MSAVMGYRDNPEIVVEVDENYPILKSSEGCVTDIPRVSDGISMRISENFLHSGFKISS